MTMHAVFFMFEDEATAERFAFDRLVEAGRVQVVEGDGYRVDGYICDTKAQAIMSVQESFGVIEFFHIYPAVDHREAVPCA